MIRAVTFDAAGTLLAPREPIGDAYARVAARFGVALDPADADRRFRAAFRHAPPLAFPDAEPGALPGLERAWWREVVRGAFGASATHPRFPAAFDALFAHYAAPDAWIVFPDVPDALLAVRARGWRVGVLSNFDGRLPVLLDALGLASLLDACVWSSAVGAAKPARAAFETAARRLGVALPELCHVGDDPDADVAGARAAGATALRVERVAAGPLAGLERLVERIDAAG